MQYRELGGNFFDTAGVYGDGISASFGKPITLGGAR